MLKRFRNKSLLFSRNHVPFKMLRLNSKDHEIPLFLNHSKLSIEIMKKTLRLFLLSFFLFLFFHPVAQIYVSADATGGSNDGSSWSNAFLDLQDAIDAVNADYQEIWIKTNTYRPNRDASGNTAPSDPRTKCFFVANYITIFRGGFNGTETSAFQANPIANPTYIDGNIGNLSDSLDNAYVLFHCNRGTDFIGLTLQASNSEGSPNLSNAAILATADETFRVMNCTLKNNYSNYRGGAVCLINSLGILFSTESTYENNFAYDQGGAIYSDGKCELDHCFFTKNTSAYGGSVKFAGLGNRAVYCTFSENTATERGASIQAYNTDVEVSNCTFYGNICSYGEFSTYSNNGSSMSFVVNNSLIVNNSSSLVGDVHSGIDGYEFNTCLANGTFNVGVTNNCSNDDPLFVSPPSNLHLQSCSPAVENINAVAVNYFNSEPKEGSLYDLGSKEYFVPVINPSLSEIYLANSFPAHPNSWQWIDCATNTNISGETGSTFTPGYSGNFALVAIFDNCSDTSNCVSFTTTSNILESNASPFSFYPNPVSSILYLNTVLEMDIQLVNISGEIISIQKIYPGTNTLDITHLSNGLYFIQSNESTKWSTQKIIKQ